MEREENPAQLISNHPAVWVSSLDGKVNDIMSSVRSVQEQILQLAERMDTMQEQVTHLGERMDTMQEQATHFGERMDLLHEVPEILKCMQREMCTQLLLTAGFGDGFHWHGGNNSPARLSDHENCNSTGD